VYFNEGYVETLAPTGWEKYEFEGFVYRIELSFCHNLGYPISWILDM